MMMSQQLLTVSEVTVTAEHGVQSVGGVTRVSIYQPKPLTPLTVSTSGTFPRDWEPQCVSTAGTRV